jgi:hypothetical protein
MLLASTPWLGHTCMSARLRCVQKTRRWEHDDESPEVVCFSSRGLMWPDTSSSGQQLLDDQTRKAQGLRWVRNPWRHNGFHAGTLIAKIGCQMCYRMSRGHAAVPDQLMLAHNTKTHDRATSRRAHRVIILPWVTYFMRSWCIYMERSFRITRRWPLRSKRVSAARRHAS